MSNDMQSVIIPKSDQLNSDDLISGPITVKITGVTIKSGEQPISIHYEGDNGKPYKACKSMCRVMVTAWGPDSKKYTGRSMTLYRDASVKWAGMEVGGIRISHMTDIDSALTMALTATKGSRKPYRVEPLKGEPTTDWAKAINDSATLEDLAKTWALVPHPLKKQYEAAKDARKAELSRPPKDDFVQDLEAAEQSEKKI